MMVAPADVYLRMGNVLSRVNYRGLTFLCGYDDGSRQPWLQVLQPEGKDSHTDEASELKGRKWRLSKHMTDGEIIQTAFMAVMAFNEHETRETFRVDGIPVFQPHFDIEALVDFAASERGQPLGRDC